MPSGRGLMTARSNFALAVTVLLMMVATPSAFAAQPAAVADLADLRAAAATPGAAGRDYATDLFADPWDYSNGEDILLDDTGPALKVSNARFENGAVRMRFTDNGYVSPIWGGYGDRMSLARDGAKTGNALDTSKYRTVSFEAYSDRTVYGGIFWFNCAGNAPTVPGAACLGGGGSIELKPGWNTYVYTPKRDFWDLNWGGLVSGLRLAVSPGPAGSDFALDWMRVTEPNSGASVSWSNPGGGSAEV